MPDRRGYTLAQPDPHAATYVAPHDPACPDTQRSMAVRCADGRWGIVDRRTGGLLPEVPPGRFRYPTRSDAAAMVDALNGGRGD